MLKAIALVVGLALLAYGGEGLYRVFTNPQQIAVTCADYARTPPRALWLRLTGCETHNIAGFQEDDGQVTELFFPVRPVGRPPTEPAILIVSTRNPAALASAQKYLGGGRVPDPEQLTVMTIDIATKLGIAREIQGLVRGGIVGTLLARQDLAALSTPVLDGASVMDLGESPNATMPGIAAALGLLLVAAPIMAAIRTRRAAAPADARIAADAQSPAPDQPAVAAQNATPPVTAREPASSNREPRIPSPEPRTAQLRLRGLLLLNLAASDTAEKIDSAPPLGPRQAVIAAIAGAVPSLTFDDRGRGTAPSSDGSLALDIGRQDPVATAVANAEGAEAIDHLRRLLAATQWRAYAPRTGDFIEPDRLADAALMKPSSGT